MRAPAIHIVKLSGFSPDSGEVSTNRRLLKVQTAFAHRQHQKVELHASSSASSRMIGCIQVGASRRSSRSSRRFSSGSVRFRCSSLERDMLLA